MEADLKYGGNSHIRELADKLERPKSKRGRKKGR